MKKLFSIIFGTFIIFFGVSQSAHSRTFALVVGINEYEEVSDLAGAVNDAHWVALSLAEFGVSELTFLINEDATRDRIEGTFFRYIDMAEPGDVIVFTYAGHGRSVEDLNHDEPTATDPDDFMDETLVLSGFSRQTPEEEILDDELSVWFRKAQQRDIRVVFLADSCFSGTVSRGGRMRRIEDEWFDIPAVPLSEVREIQVSSTYDENPENLTFLSGASENEPVQEVVIDGRFHGALSYSFGVALQGSRSDLDSNGFVSRDELAKYVVRVTKGNNDGRVLPKVVAKLGDDFPVLTPDPEARKFDIKMPPKLENLDELVSRSAGDISLTYRPDLSWNKDNGDITDANGEVVAKSVDPIRLPEVEAKFELLELSRETLERESFDVTLTTEDAQKVEVLHLGQPFKFEVGPVPYPFLTIFNLSNNGDVQLVYPLDHTERGAQPLGSRISFNAEAADPVGIDHIVALATKKEPETLRQQLNWNMPSDALVGTLDRLTLEENVAVAIVSVATLNTATADLH